MTAFWQERTPSKRCDWLDQLRGWAVIVMIEVHVVNVWLQQGLKPTWLEYLNGLVAPSFIFCAGYSLVLSTFKSDGTLRPFWPVTAKRLGFILLCAYALHAPGFTLAEWTVLSTPQKFRELFKIDVLQCIVFSLLILHGLARIVRRPAGLAGLGALLALAVAWVSPHLWRTGIADGTWLPVRGLINGNVDRGVQALFSLFPWFAFAAAGTVIGVLYWHFRVMAQQDGTARWSEGRWLAFLASLGLLFLLWGTRNTGTWLQHGPWQGEELWRLHNTTLPSVAQRAGIVCLAGAFLGVVGSLKLRLPGPDLVGAASRESLLVYMLHLILIFSVLLTNPIKGLLGIEWYSMGWPGTLLMTALIIAVNLAAALVWQQLRQRADQVWIWQRRLLWVGAAWFILGGWWTYAYLRQSPELATEPYAFLNEARIKKALSPTPDGLCRNGDEYFLEASRRGQHLSEPVRVKILEQIQKRREDDRSSR